MAWLHATLSLTVTLTLTNPIRHNLTLGHTLNVSYSPAQITK